MKISTRTCKRRLAALWFVAGLASLALLAVQSMLGKYGSKTQEAWAWFLPTAMPTLLLIMGVLVVDFTSPKKADKRIERFMFWLVFGISVFYLVLVAMVPLLQPFTASSSLELMQRSNLWLGPLQGLVTAAMGAFFVKGEREG